MKAIAGENRLL
ncbi:hypothetical protein CP8484711_1625A, partial [Chlamydia psittaci 84-8471/1]